MSSSIGAWSVHWWARYCQFEILLLKNGQVHLPAGRQETFFEAAGTKPRLLLAHSRPRASSRWKTWGQLVWAWASSPCAEAVWDAQSPNYPVGYPTQPQLGQSVQPQVTPGRRPFVRGVLVQTDVIFSLKHLCLTATIRGSIGQTACVSEWAAPKRGGFSLVYGLQYVYERPIKPS